MKKKEVAETPSSKEVRVFGSKVLLKIEKLYKKDDLGRPVKDGDGNELYDLAQAAKVVHSGIEGIKKGMTVFPVTFGGVAIQHLETKKHYFLVIDDYDIYAFEV